jgi:molybdopterin synthase sulfur carrier subunit
MLPGARQESRMGVRVSIPGPLRKHTGGVGEIEALGASVQQLLDSLTAEHTGLSESVLDEHGRIRRSINVFVNQQNIRHLNGLDTPLADGDRVSIVSAIAGG